MILSWFTQPPGGFSSYYQFDTATREFSRIRLELGRQSETRTTDTFVSYNSDRAVGFSAQRLSTSDLTRWSVDEDGQLCFDDVALPSDKPSAGDRVYDSSNPDSFVHRGNPVTDAPVLPQDIQAKHLALLANDALLTRKGFTLTANDAGELALSAAIKGQVCRVLNVQDFATVSDQMILNKLTEQAEIQRAFASQDHVRDLDSALNEAKKAADLIDEQIREGVITPDEAFTKACVSFQEAINKARTATTTESDVEDALAEIGTAQQELAKAIAAIDTAKFESTAKQLELTQQSLEQAQAHAEDWQMAEEEYDSLVDADTIAEYEEGLGLTEPEEVV